MSVGMSSDGSRAAIRLASLLTRTLSGSTDWCAYEWMSAVLYGHGECVTRVGMSNNGEYVVTKSESDQAFARKK